ncbi:MAG TPA: tRNA (adenosine(37)-N6)-threonylcarbamoyltransferase complex dimerization subunit type 1 TsaB [Aquabacterium sp.]|nr:tRNA (adenosine(37)-N6)-threonylcarbamoyltransferase complex dimerization subunit type 1 TsaB [Aquabacterium sp.]HRH28326.1 tRNA (adenosine(37)-N6)-threonylcarbamoyltransferase complex dimerization subunit type 1 TsaB [Aquabacterium sp.]
MSSSATPCLIALDTATEVVHLALCEGGRVHARAVGGGAQASVSTLPALNAALAQAGLAWSDVQAIAFGRGPGAFTGLRTSCAIAQGLALALGIPVLALDTLLAVAEAARQDHPGIEQALRQDSEARLWVLQDARMSEVYAASFRWVDGQWQVDQAPVLWPLAHLRERVARGQLRLVAGSALSAYPDDVAGLAEQGASLAPDARPHGRALAALAQAAWAAGEALDAALALPLYVRDKVAQTTAERMADRQQAPGAAVAAGVVTP